MTWYRTPLFELLDIPLMSLEHYQVLRYVLLVALLLTALGVWTRVSATVAWMAFFLYIGTYLGFLKSPIPITSSTPTTICVFVLFILSIAPGVRVLRL